MLDLNFLALPFFFCACMDRVLILIILIIWISLDLLVSFMHYYLDFRLLNFFILCNRLFLILRRRFRFCFIFVYSIRFLLLINLFLQRLHVTSQGNLYLFFFFFLARNHLIETLIVLIIFQKDILVFFNFNIDLKFLICFRTYETVVSS